MWISSRHIDQPGIEPYILISYQADIDGETMGVVADSDSPSGKNRKMFSSFEEVAQNAIAFCKQSKQAVIRYKSFVIVPEDFDDLQYNAKMVDLLDFIEKPGLKNLIEAYELPQEGDSETLRSRIRDAIILNKLVLRAN